LWWHYLSAPISIKRKCPPSFRTWKRNLFYWRHCSYHKWILWKSFEQIGWDIAMIERKQLTSQWWQVLLLCNWSRVPWICTYPTRSQTWSQKGWSNCQDCYTKNSQTSPLLHRHDKLLQGPYPTSFRLTHTTYWTYQERCLI
jgi:hypothetical protein